MRISSCKKGTESSMCFAKKPFCVPTSIPRGPSSKEEIRRCLLLKTLHFSSLDWAMKGGGWQQLSSGAILIVLNLSPELPPHRMKLCFAIMNCQRITSEICL